MSRDQKTPTGAPSRPAAKPAEAKGAARKKYAAPKVKPYGNIRDITLGTGHSGNLDNLPGSLKTSV